MKNIKVLLTMLVLMLSALFAMSNDGGQQPLKLEKDGEKVTVQDTQQTEQPTMYEINNPTVSVKSKDSSQVKSEIDLGSFTTEELIYKFISNTSMLTTLGLFEDYNTRVRVVLSDVLTKELLRRENVIENILKIYKIKANTNDFKSKELIILLLSSKDVVKFMKKSEKHETIKITYSIYFANEIDPKGVIPPNALYLFTNILEGEGYNVMPNKAKYEDKSDLTFFRDWQGAIILKGKDYIDSKE